MWLVLSPSLCLYLHIGKHNLENISCVAQWFICAVLFLIFIVTWKDTSTMSRGLVFLQNNLGYPLIPWFKNLGSSFTSCGNSIPTKEKLRVFIHWREEKQICVQGQSLLPLRILLTSASSPLKLFPPRCAIACCCQWSCCSSSLLSVSLLEPLQTRFK